MSSQPLIEVRSIDFVPLEERHGKVWHLWPIWFAGDAHLVTLATGALGIGMGLNLFWSAMAIIGGCALGTFFMAFHAAQGPQLGLPQMIQSRPQFGYFGALLVWVVALVTYIGYNAFNQVLAGLATHPTMIAFTLVALIVALIGNDLIHTAQRVLAYTLIAILAAFSIGVLIAVPLPAGQLDPLHFAIVPFLVQFFAAAAYQLSWSIYVSDYSRYLRDCGCRLPADERDRRRARSGGYDRARLRHGAAGGRARQPDHRHLAQFLRRVAHPAQHRRCLSQSGGDGEEPGDFIDDRDAGLVGAVILRLGQFHAPI